MTTKRQGYLVRKKGFGGWEVQKKRFFEGIARRSTYLTAEFIEEAYREMLRYITLELRTKKVVTLPDFGTFTVVRHKARRAHHAFGRKFVIMGPTTALKWQSDKKIKAYFKELGNIEESMQKAEEKV